MLALRTLRANSDWENYWDQNIKKSCMILPNSFNCTPAVYLGLMPCNQKVLLVETKSMVLNREVAVDKE